MTALLAATVFIGLPPQAPIGKDVSFKARTLQGAEVSTQVLRGKPSLIVLWGPWSAQSSRALEIAQAVKEKYGTKLRVIAVTTWDTEANTVSFLRQNAHLKFEFWLDPAEKNTAESIAVKVFESRKFPSIFVLNGAMKLVGGFVGFKPGDDLDELIRTAIG